MGGGAHGTRGAREPVVKPVVVEPGWPVWSLWSLRGLRGLLGLRGLRGGCVEPVWWGGCFIGVRLPVSLLFWAGGRYGV